MIDTVKFRYSIHSEEQMILLAKWLENTYTESFQEVRNGDGSKYFRCKIHNLLTSVSNEYLTINGSLNKLWLGNNIQALPINDIPLAINYLNTLLGNIVDIKQARVRRLDFGSNIIMDYRPTSYICKLHSSSLKTPTYYNGQTISSGNNSRGMIVYDKTEEAVKDKGITISVPDNLLRLEVKQMGRHVFEKYFGNPLPKVADIVNQLNKLPDIWYNEYNRLDKEYNVTVDSVSNQNELFEYTISKAGFADCVNVINYSYQLGVLNAQNRYRYYKLVKSVFNPSRGQERYDLMQELDEKVAITYEQLKAVK